MRNRREFLLAGLATLALPAAGAAAGPEPDPWAAEFAGALGRDPFWLGWRSPVGDRMQCGIRLRGRLPEALRGTFWRIGPAVHERFGLRYHHWFEGDGMIHRFRFDGAAIRHHGRVLDTPKLERERAAGRRLFAAFATPIPDGAPVRRPDDVNTANTALLDHHGSLYALWEAGSASRIDRDTLAWSGFRSWGEGLAGLPFSAHPRVDADGSVRGFGVLVGRRPGLLLYHIGGDGSLRRVDRVDIAPMSMVHDFVLTRRHLVFVLPPLVFAPEQAEGSFLDAHVWRPELGTRVLVVAKADPSRRRWYQLPAGFGFHHGNGWEEGDGTLRFDHCLAADASLLRDRFRGVMRGRLEPATEPVYHRFRLGPDGSARVEATIGGRAEFPQISRRLTGRRNRFVYLTGGVRGEGFHQLVKRDLESGSSERHDYGDGVHTEEHLFVPRPGGSAEDDGWLVGTLLDYRRRATGVVVLDARRPGDGPLAEAWLDEALPLGFHGCFSPA